MILRDEFANSALTGIMSNSEIEKQTTIKNITIASNVYAEAIAKTCYQIADAMLEEREKEC